MAKRSKIGSLLSEAAKRSTPRGKLLFGILIGGGMWPATKKGRTSKPVKARVSGRARVGAHGLGRISVRVSTKKSQEKRRSM